MAGKRHVIVGGGTFDFAMTNTKIERIQALSPEPT